MLKNNLVEFLFKNSGATSGISFIQSQDKEVFISYAELFLEVQKTASFLDSHGVRKGDELIFQINDNFLFVKVFWACLIKGIIPVPLHVAMNSETRFKLINVWNSLNNPAIISDSKSGENLSQKLDFSELKRFSSSRLLVSDNDFSLYPSFTEYDNPDEDQIAFIQFSSGSTGTPKGVTLTHRNLLANIEAIVHGANLSAADKTMGWMPLTHDLGLIGFHLTPFSLGINQYILDTDAFVRRPSNWIDLLHKYRVSFTASPNFGYKHFMTYNRGNDAAHWDLSCVKRILNGAEPISVEVANEFLDTLAPYGLKREVMFPVYGMAEASLAITFPEPDQVFHSIKVSRDKLLLGKAIVLDENGIDLISVGKPIMHCEVRISDDTSIPLADGHVGFIKIHGKNVTKGYYNNPTETQNTINSTGWLKTGDLGFFHKGELFITGRSKDIIFSNGINLYPHDLERLAEQIEGVNMGRIVFTGIFNHHKGADDILCFLVYRNNLENFVKLSKEIRHQISTRISADIDYIIPVNAIPKTTSGKIQRYLLAERYKQGEFAEVLAELEAIASVRTIMEPKTESQRKIFDLWNAELDGQIKSVQDNFFEFGGNSLKASILCGRISKEFAVDLSLRELFKNPTIELLAELLSTKNTEEFKHIPLTSVRQFYPCSSAQKRLYILHQLEPEKTNYHITTIHQLTGKPDVERLNITFNELIKRHEILRTNFITSQGEPVQVIHEAQESNIDVIEIEQSTFDTELKAAIVPFNLENGDLFRAKLFQVKNSDISYLLFDIHHIVMDGFSLNQLVLEFTQLYNKETPENSSISFKDYAVWETDFLATKKVKIQEEYWLNEFRELPANLDLPTDFSRNTNNENKAQTTYIHLDKKLSDTITKLVESQQLTHFHLFFSAFSVLLSRYSGKSDLVIGTPIINRPHIDVQQTLGTFINTLPFRVDLSTKLSARQFLSYIQDKSMDIFTHQNYPFERLVEHLSLARDVNRNPLFDVFFVYQNANDGTLKLDNLEVKKIPFNNEFTKFDLNVHITENEGCFDIMLEYNSGIFKADTIKQMGLRYAQLLQSFCVQNTVSLQELDWLNADEKLAVQQAGQGKIKNLTAVHALEKFSKRVQQTPDKKALVAGSRSWTYSELDRISNFYALQLQEKGIQQGQMTGISFAAYEKVIVAILACWKAGVPYVPIDPNNPEERNKHIISDSGLSIVFSDYEISDAQQLDIDFSKESAPAILPLIDAESIAYVIYTSGTTGKPKGTLIPHKALVNYTDWLQNEFELDDKQQSVLLSSYAFDLGYTTLYGTLLNGGTLHVLTEEYRQEAAFVLDYIAKNEISYIKTTPSQLYTFIHSPKRDLFGKMPQLKKVFIGGEPIKVHDLRELQDLNPAITVINHYGPTESTIGCVAKRIENLDEFAQQPVIGSPMQNASVQILGTQQEFLPTGIIGELCISGVGLSAGYYKQEAQSKDKFITINEQRYYRTGDLAKRSDTGEIILLGRNDDQVKIRGYRVELLEIEKSLSSLDGVEEALVLSYKDASAQDALLAYVVFPGEFSAKEIKNKLKSLLPAFMVPETILQLDAIPLTANGKLDKSKLPKPDTQVAERSVTPLSDFTPGQLKLYEIWKDLLQVEAIDLQDNFFNLGGHSLKANMLVSRIHKHFEVELRLKDIFEHPTLDDLELLIQTKEIKRFTAISKAEKRPFYPCSSAQQRMYVLHEIQPESIAYNMSGAFIISGKIDMKRLNKAFITLVERHESLRTGFRVENGQIVQQIHDAFAFDVEMIEEVSNTEASVHAFIRPFDLSKAPLFRIGLGKLQHSSDHLLIFDMHHIISDGTSMGILIQDFTAIYDDKELPELSIQYADFAVWQENYLKSSKFEEQKNYWINKFSDQVPLLDLNTDFIRPDELKASGSNFSYVFEKELTRKLLEFVQKHQTTLFIVLTSFYSLLIAKKSKQEDLVIGTPVAGRFHHDLQQLIGVFLNMLPLRIKLNMELTFAEFLKANHTQFIQDFENQNFPFDRLIDELNFERNLNRNPLFDTMLVVQNMDLEELKTNDLTFTPYEFDLGISQLDLSLVVFEQENAINFTVEFNTELFKKETVYRLMEEFELLIEKGIAQEDKQLKNFDLLNDAERNEMLHEAYSNFSELSEFTIVDKLAFCMDRYAERVVVRDFEQTQSYSELQQKTARVQEFLLANGIQRGDVVALYVESDTDLLALIYGILATGAVYLPLDPMFPEQRIEFMLKDSGCKLMITNLKEVTFAVQIARNSEVLSFGSMSTFVNYSKPEDRAYIIYTSGTTGTPKGVLIKHYSLLDYILTYNELIGFGSADCIIQSSSISFDASMEELFAAPLCGGSIFIVNHKKDLNLIRDAIETGFPTILITSPLVMSFINQSLYDYKSIKYLICGGDEMKSEHFNAVPKHIEIWNGYGPTESTVCITFKKVDRSEHIITLGSPIRNRHVFVMDSYQNLLPKGALGELCVSGSGLAEGYLNAEEQTRSKFIPNPYEPGKLIYRTGDLVRWNSVNELEYFGRIDKQVKIRGYRIELGEITNSILGIAGVQDCYVRVLSSESDKQLVAYFTSELHLSEHQLVKELSEKLPSYMIPSHFIALAELPINQSGKIDEKSLPEPMLEYETDSDDELSDSELILSETIKTLLKRSKISIQASFFEIGGDSIKAIQLVNALQQKGYLLEVKQIFEAKSIRDLALNLNKSDIEINQDEQQGIYPLSPIQAEFFNTSLENQSFYNQSFAISGNERIDLAKVANAYRKIIAHHDNLRTVFVRKESSWEAVIQPNNEDMAVDIPHEELSDEWALRAAFAQAQASLNIESGILFKCFSYSFEQKSILFFVCHHLLVDAVSWRIILEDFVNLYADEHYQLPLKTSSFIDFSKAIHEYAKQAAVLDERSFWKHAEQDAKGELFGDSAGKIADSEVLEFALSEELTEQLMFEANKVYNTKPEDLLLSALVLTFKEWKNCEKLQIDLEAHGRESFDEKININRTVGWFTSVFPVQLESRPDIRRTIIDNKDYLHKIPKKGFHFLILKNLSGQDLPELHRSEVLYNFLGEIGQEDASSIFSIHNISDVPQIDGKNRKEYPFEINQFVKNKQLYCKLSYSNTIGSSEIETFKEIYTFKLIEIVNYCMGKETSEITQSDLSFDISMDDFDNIFGND